MHISIWVISFSDCFAVGRHFSIRHSVNQGCHDSKVCLCVTSSESTLETIRAIRETGDRLDGMADMIQIPVLARVCACSRACARVRALKRGFYRVGR